MCDPTAGPAASAAGVHPGPEHELARRTREFYEHYQFPGVRPLDQDGLILMRRLGVASAGRTAARAERLRVLDAGCGTGNTVVSLARHLVEVDFVGVDFSQPSLDVARGAAEGTANLRFRLWNLEDAGVDEQPFDVVLCLGVLHHTADMPRVVRNLRLLMKEQGELYLWVYGRHGRYRHSLNQRLLRMLVEASPGSSDAVELAHQFISSVNHGAPLEDLLGSRSRTTPLRSMIEQRAWVADQFLHPNERQLDIEELMHVAASAGLELGEWLGVPAEPSAQIAAPELLRRFRSLSRGQQLLALDLLLKPDHYFVTLRNKSSETKS